MFLKQNIFFLLYSHTAFKNLLLLKKYLMQIIKTFLILPLETAVILSLMYIYAEL